MSAVWGPGMPLGSGLLCLLQIQQWLARLSGDPANEVSLEWKVWWVNKREADQRNRRREVSLILTYKHANQQYKRPMNQYLSTSR